MKLREFIKNLQNSDYTVKKRWLIGLSGVSMIIIIAIWLIYLNYSIEAVGVEEIKEPEIGFWRIMATGSVEVFNQIENGFQNLFYKIIYKRTIMIE
ncbi:MAG: hypothetical protein AAB366_03070 [Patescibacteria group bacterium]|mgnify:CR=1 FL=1